MSISIAINPHESLYLRDPKSTELGRNIIKHGIELMSELGFEEFTFKKLATKMGSSEVTVYRYFENKHKFLLYLVCWYWEWASFLVEWRTQNIVDPRERLSIALEMIVSSSETNALVDYVDESKLYKIIIEESTKAYHTKAVDTENKQGLFKSLKSLNATISKMILNCKPNYPHPNSLAVYVLEMSKNYYFYAQHLPSLTEVKKIKDPSKEVLSIIEEIVFRQINS